MEEPIAYFFEQENQYLQSHPDEPVFEDEMEDDPLDFLRKQPFSSYYMTLQKHPLVDASVKAEKGITETEELMLFLMIGEYSWYFRADRGIECLPQIRQEMIRHWDSFLGKIPVCKADKVYRHCHSHDIIDFSVGEEWLCQFSLTTREEEWPLNEDENMYEVHLLPQKLTRAKAIWEIYNHGQDCGSPEYQVNFLSNTKFHIDDIVLMDNGGKKIIMHEIQ